MITDADRALVRNIKAGKVLDGAWDAMHHREEAYALGRIEGAKAMQEVTVNLCATLAETTYDASDEFKAMLGCEAAIRALDPKTIAEGKP